MPTLILALGFLAYATGVVACHDFAWWARDEHDRPSWLLAALWPLAAAGLAAAVTYRLARLQVADAAGIVALVLGTRPDAGPE